uniref:Uncharacterized protein n=1 Tax=Panagrolaimus superbus TaxID=310955 RepID=A0A914YQP4_9BILA
MSDIDEYEKIDIDDVQSETESKIVAMQIDTSEITKMETSMVNNQIAEELIEEMIEAVVEREEKTKKIQMFDTVSSTTLSSKTTSATTDHKKSVKVTNQKMSELKITTPKVIFIHRNCSKGKEANSDPSFVFYKSIQKSLVKNFAETQSLKTLAAICEINDKLAKIQGFNDNESLIKSVPIPCSSKTSDHQKNTEKLLNAKATLIVHGMNSFFKNNETTLKDENAREKFLKIHQKFLKLYLKISGIENPLIEKEKMKAYCKILYPNMNQIQQKAENLLVCPFGKYMIEQKNGETSNKIPAQIYQTPSDSGKIPTPIYTSPSDPSILMEYKFEAALSEINSTQKEYMALLDERDKAYAEDPKDTQLHEHMTKLCMEALTKSRKALKEYQNLCATEKAALKSTSAPKSPQSSMVSKSPPSTSKLTVVEGPTCNIPPKSINFGFDEGANESTNIEDPRIQEGPKNLMFSMGDNSFMKIPFNSYLRKETVEDLLALSNALESTPSTTTTKFRHFNTLKQYQLYTLLSHSIEKPEKIQSEILEALKNGIFGIDQSPVGIHSFTNKNSTIAEAYKNMLEAQEKCSEILEEKGLAVLGEPENKLFQEDLMKSCCEAYKKWKLAKNIYIKFETSLYAREASKKSTSKNNENLASKNLCTNEKLNKMDEEMKVDNDEICINNDKNNVTIAFYEMKGVENGDSESSKLTLTPQKQGYSNPAENDDEYFKILDGIDLATIKTCPEKAAATTTAEVKTNEMEIEDEIADKKEPNFNKNFNQKSRQTTEDWREAQVQQNLKDTENSRKTLIEMNEVLKAQKEDFQAKYKSVKEMNEYLENECKKLYNSFSDNEQKYLEAYKKVIKQKDATIAQLQTELAQTKNNHEKSPNKLIQLLEDVKLEDKQENPKESDSKLTEELMKAQKQIKFYKKLAGDQAEALKNMEFGKIP